MSVTDRHRVKQFIRHPIDIPFFRSIEPPTDCSLGVKGCVLYRINQWLPILGYTCRYRSVTTIVFKLMSKSINACLMAINMPCLYYLLMKKRPLRPVWWSKVVILNIIVEKVMHQEERCLSQDEAASEWIEKYANRFPNFMQC